MITHHILQVQEVINNLEEECETLLTWLLDKVMKKMDKYHVLVNTKDGIYLIREGNKEFPIVNVNISKIKRIKVTQRLNFNENIPLILILIKILIYRFSREISEKASILEGNYYN